MNPEYKNIERFDNYLYGEMSADERFRFEEEIETDIDLKREFDAYKAVHETVIELETVDLRSTISSDLDDIFREQKRKKDIKKWLGGFLGLSILVVGVLVANEEETVTEKIDRSDKAEAIDNKVSKEELIVTSESNALQKDEIRKELVDTAPTVVVNRMEGVSLEDSIIEPSNLKTLEAGNEPSNDETFQHSNHSTSEPTKLPTINPCEGKVLQVPVKYVKPSYDREDGKIWIQLSQLPHLSGVMFSYDEAGFSNQTSFENLAEGSHVVRMKDKDGCIFEKTVTLTRTNCINEYSKTFSPAYEQEWLIPCNMDVELSASFTLLDERGQVKIERIVEPGEEVGIESGELNELDLQANYYRFTITYSDGQVCPGELTIIK